MERDGQGGLSAAEVAGRLRAAGCIAPEEEAGELLAAAADDATLEAWIRRREHGEPLAWITGTTELVVDPDDPVPEGYLLSDTWPGSDVQ